ncbi:Cell division protein FtsL [Candidatus Methanoperedenaceae archaeon GB50]|nr:hypothetical protein [Candidatus Desulfofervidus auxilii]CAD7780479.1 Cell division protein FtsL [Candidatus Methanoperedenaceae archaeon GB50]
MTIAVWARANRKLRTYTWQIKWVGINILIILVTCLIYVWLSMHSIQIGFQITEAMQVQKRLKEHNYALRSQWAHLTSPSYLKGEAEKLGLQVPENIIKLNEGN